jgi:hypothetical protein
VRRGVCVCGGLVEGMEILLVTECQCKTCNRQFLREHPKRTQKDCNGTMRQLELEPLSNDQTDVLFPADVNSIPVQKVGSLDISLKLDHLCQIKDWHNRDFMSHMSPSPVCLPVKAFS